MASDHMVVLSFSDRGVYYWIVLQSAYIEQLIGRPRCTAAFLRAAYIEQLVGLLQCT